MKIASLILGVRRCRTTPFIALGLVTLLSASCLAGSVSGTYFGLDPGDAIDLTAEGTLDWIKFGNGENDTTSFFVVTKIGNPVFLPATLAPLGTAPEGDVELIAFTGKELLNFTWTNGNFGMWDEPNPVDTVVTETILPEVNEYPIGLGATFDALASALPRVMNVYVQGFNADMLITASMSGGGSDSVVVTPTENPPLDPNNDFAIGFYQIVYSGAGETLTVSVETQNPLSGGAQEAFANAGFFAATVIQVPEPAGITLFAVGSLAAAVALVRRRRCKRPL
jgi:hypothetical protein